MLTAAEIEEWDMSNKAEPGFLTLEEIDQLEKRAVKAERQRDELLSVLREILAAVHLDDTNKPSAKHARGVIAKIEGENNAQG